MNNNQPTPTNPVNPTAPSQSPSPVPPQPAEPTGSLPPSSDFLTRMDTANNPNPEPKKKKLSAGATIGIIIGVVALIGGGVTAYLMLNKTGTPEPTSTVTTTASDEPTEPELSDEIVARNELRKNDLKDFIRATITFQTNNNGSLPGEQKEQWEWLLNNKQYLPDGVKDGATGDEYKIGTVCKFGENCVDINNLTWEADHHKIFILLNAACKGETKDDVIVSYTGKRKAAIFTILEGSRTFLCENN